MATRHFDRNKDLSEKVSFLIGAGASVKYIADKAVTIKHISFYNQSGSAFTSAASVDNAGSTVVLSSATLAANTPEEKEDGDLSNTSVADGAIITLAAGDMPTAIVVTFVPDFTA